MFYRHKRTLYSLIGVRRVTISPSNKEILMSYSDGGCATIYLGGSEQEAIMVFNDIEKILNGR